MERNEVIAAKFLNDDNLFTTDEIVKMPKPANAGLMQAQYPMLHDYSYYAHRGIETCSACDEKLEWSRQQKWRRQDPCQESGKRQTPSHGGTG